MRKQIFNIISLFLLISCARIEETSLLRYSDKNKNHRIEIIEKEFNEKDSLLFEWKSFKIFDKRNRLINHNNLQFFFYNSYDKIDKIKSVYKRGRKTNILTEKYHYDNEKIIFVTFQFKNKVDTIQSFSYNVKNQLTEKKDKRSTIEFKYQNNQINIETKFENGEIEKESKYVYDNKGRRIVNNWFFNGNQKMRTYYKYNIKNKIISERDSCITTFGKLNEFVEYLTEYYYDGNDSIIEKRDLGRVLSEKDFKLRRKTKYEYKKM